MRREAGRKKWIGLALIIILCLAGVYGAGVTEDIPVYASFPCTAETCKTTAPAAGRGSGQGIYETGLPASRLTQNGLLRRPDEAWPAERIQQSRPDLLTQGGPGRRVTHRSAVEADSAALAELPGAPGGYCSRDNRERSFVPCSSRIISYIHDQDGQKDNILSGNI